MSQPKTINPKGESLSLEQLLKFATIRQSDIDEMVRLSHRTMKPFINAAIRPQ